MRRETPYKRTLIEKLEMMFPDCVIIRNDPAITQGIPDLLILWGCRWAMLEVKRSESASIRPNQEYYVEQYGNMSYASFIYPENEEVVLQELYHFMTA
jgi:hypothetical protein